MHPLQKLFSKTRKNVVGLISGTSVDGVDAAIVQIEGSGKKTKLNFIHALTYEYPGGLKDKILSLSTPGQGTVDEICYMNTLLGEIFASAVFSLVEEAKISLDEIDLIGSHGQTVHHLPHEKSVFGYKIRSTLQLGEPSVIAKRTGIVTVADFRTADMALGGEGAPLVPYLDYILFSSREKNRAVLNIGGIANFTVLKKSCSLNEIIAFDTGPGNMIIDALVKKFFHKPFDEYGRIAQSGKVSKDLLNFCLTHPYFKKRPPKSTGREEFGQEFISQIIDFGSRLHLTPEEIVATATEFTALTIWQAYSNFVDCKIDELIISGGGLKNQAIVDALARYFNQVNVRSTDEFGIPSDTKEAICFAVLANETIMGNPANVPSVTGARKPTILGKICL